MVWQQESHGPDDMGCQMPQGFSFPQRFAHHTEFVIFEVTQSTVNQLG